MRLLERVIKVLAPHNCLSCGREGSLLCVWCKLDACDALPTRCYRCHALTAYSRVCNRCRPRTKLTHVWVRTEYEGLAKDLIRHLKFERAQAAAVVMAELMNETLPFLEDDTIIVHVPTTSIHVRQRGYDQAKLIAARLSMLTKRPRLTLLSRRGQTQQVGSKRRERLSQLSGAFFTQKPELLSNAKVLLVDDVLTTGATIEEAARTLKSAGAKRIDAVVFASAQ